MDARVARMLPFQAQAAGCEGSGDGGVGLRMPQAQTGTSVDRGLRQGGGEEDVILRQSGR